MHCGKTNQSTACCLLRYMNGFSSRTDCISRAPTAANAQQHPHDPWFMAGCFTFDTLNQLNALGICFHPQSHVVMSQVTSFGVFMILNAEQTFARVCDCANLGCVSSKPRVRTVFWSPSHLGMVTWLTPSPSSKSLRDVSPRSTPSPLLCALKRFTVSIDFCCVRLIKKHRIIKSVGNDNLNKQHKRADEDDTPLESHSVCQTSLGISQMHQHIQQ